ncbi:MAG: rod shape-determining protein MreC [Verrucomicrobiota bacterium]|jgi:rod shape-determining protein MreC
MFKKKRYIALAIVALVALVLLNLPANTSARLRLAISSPFVPLFGLSSVSQNVAGSTADLALSKSELIRQNNQLRAEIAQLKIQQAQSAEQVRENARLRQFVNWQTTRPWQMKLARVVVRDPANWWSTVQIDVGSQHGIKVNMTVVTPAGLIGRVSAVGTYRSQVTLLGDPNCKVAAVVLNGAGEAGVIGNASPLDRSMVELGYLPPTASLKPNQDVVTSGLGGIFPRGIPIGKVVDSRQVEFGIATEARVKLSASLGAVDEVWVILQ